MALSDYVVCEEIGSGSYARVYKCKGKRDNKLYVMKKIKVVREASHSVFEKEHTIMRPLRHRNIVRFKTQFLTDDVFCIVMEYCTGGDLASKIAQRKREGLNIERTQIMDWMIDICFGLQCMHGQNTIHRDLKPENIFLAAKNVAKIGDFGTARLLAAGKLAEASVGTPLYQSPEVARGRPYNSKADMWSLGCCLYELMALRPAVDVVRLLNDEEHVIGEIPDNYGEELRWLTERLLNREAERRPSVDEILTETFIKERVFANLNQRITVHCERLDKLAKNIRTVSDELTRLHHRLLKARLGTAAVGVVCGVTAVVAGVATVLTAGALAPLVIGVVAGSASAVAGLSGLATQAAQKVIEGKQVRKMKFVLEKTKDEAEELHDVLMSILRVKDMADHGQHTKLFDIMTLLQDEFNTGHYESGRRRAASAFGQTTGTAGNTATTGAYASRVALVASHAGRGARIAVSGVRVAGSLGAVFGVLGVGIDIWQIVVSSLELAKENPSVASKKLLKIAEAVTGQAHDMRHIWGINNDQNDTSSCSDRR